MITSDIATLSAAVLAAATAIVNLLFTISAKRQQEFRAAYRRSLEVYIHELSEAIHQTTASTNVLFDADGDQGVRNWRSRAKQGQKQLKELRRKLRYPLHGIIGGMRTLTRFPSWVDHVRDYPESGAELVKKGNKLTAAIHRAVRRSYLRGRHPSLSDCALVKYRAWRLEKARNRIMEIPQDERP